MGWTKLLVLAALWSMNTGTGECTLEFADATYAISVPESPAADSDVPSPPTPPPVAAVAAACTGEGVLTQDIRYSVLEGSLGRINETTGEFSFETESLDYETQSVYEVRLLCYLSSNSTINATSTVTVTITPINEYLPVIMSVGGNTITIPESSSPGALIAAVDQSMGPLIAYTASDRDEGPDGVITFTLADEASNELFDLNRETGELLLRSSLPDIDTAETPFEQFNIIITACNEHITLSDCNSIILTLFVTGANDIAPEYEPAIYPVSLPESLSISSLVVETNCIDRDFGPGSAVTTMFHDNTSQIVLDSFTLSSDGVVTLKAPLDYEQGPINYQFQLVCSDGEHQTNAQVLVVVDPTNDNAPIFVQESYEFTLDRSSPAGHTVGQVRAEDDDIDIGSNITYSIDDESYFSVDSVSGDISVRDHIPSSAGSQFELQAFATDGDFVANSSVMIRVRGAVSLPEFAGIVAGLLIFISLVVGVLSVIGAISFCYIRATRRSAYAVERATLSADVTPSQKVVRFADDEFSSYIPTTSVVLTNPSTQANSHDTNSTPSQEAPPTQAKAETALSAPENEEVEETSFTQII